MYIVASSSVIFCLFRGTFLHIYMYILSCSQVQSKRKRHSSKEQKKELRQYTAPFLNSAPVSGGKQVKKNNFERLVVRMQQEFQHAKKYLCFTIKRNRIRYKLTEKEMPSFSLFYSV